MLRSGEDSPFSSGHRTEHEPVAAKLFQPGKREIIMFKKLIGLTLALACTLALAHGGGTDRNGCHHERSSGGYHCH